MAQLEWLGLQDLRRVVPDLLEVRLAELEVNCELEDGVGKQSEEMPCFAHVLKGSLDGDQPKRHGFRNVKQLQFHLCACRYKIFHNLRIGIN